MTDCTKKNARCWATWMSLFLWCLTCGGNGQKTGFRGGAKSYEIHVEANTIGTNLHYKLPEAKVKAAGKAKEDWVVDNDNAEMSSVNSPLLAVVSVKHPKFSTKGKWPGYKLKFKVPKDVSESGAKKTNFIRPALSERRKTWFATQEDSASGMGESALGSGSDLNPRVQNEDQLPITLRNSKTKQDLQSIKKLTESSKQRSSRQIRPTEESNSTGVKEQREFPKSGSSLQLVAGLLSPLEKLQNLRLKNPTIDKEMATIVAHAKRVVSEAKTVLKDAAGFVSNVKSLVHGGKNMELNGIADYARKAVEEVGTGGLGLLRESTAIAKGAAATGLLRAVARHAAKPVKHAGPHVSLQDGTSEKSTKEAEKDSKSSIGVATKTIKPNGEVMAGADGNNDLNHDGSSSGAENTPNPQPADGKRRRRESNVEGEDEPESVENFFLSLNNLKDLLGLRRK